MPPIDILTLASQGGAVVILLLVLWFLGRFLLKKEATIDAHLAKINELQEARLNEAVQNQKVLGQVRVEMAAQATETSRTVDNLTKVLGAYRDGKGGGS